MEKKKPVHLVAERELITQNCELKKKKKKNMYLFYIISGK